MSGRYIALRQSGTHSDTRVLALALLLAVAGASAPLAVMQLVDELAAIAAAGSNAPPDAGRAIFLALLLVAATELAQVLLARGLETRSWQVRLDRDFALRQRVTARVHQLPLAFHQRQTVGATATR